MLLLNAESQSVVKEFTKPFEGFQDCLEEGIIGAGMGGIIQCCCVHALHSGFILGG